MLTRLLSKAVAESADAVEFEYQDRKLYVIAFRGPMGVGIGSIDSNTEECDRLVDQILALKRRKRLKLGARTIGIAVSTYESFSATVWRIALSQAP